jgi:hypothetical protein
MITVVPVRGTLIDKLEASPPHVVPPPRRSRLPGARVVRMIPHGCDMVKILVPASSIDRTEGTTKDQGPGRSPADAAITSWLWALAASTRATVGGLAPRTPSSRTP